MDFKNKLGFIDIDPNAFNGLIFFMLLLGVGFIGIILGCIYLIYKAVKFVIKKYRNKKTKEKARKK